MTTFGVATDYEHTQFGRQMLQVWSGPFFGVWEAQGVALPKSDGFMLTTYNGDKVRVTCPAPRDESNFHEVDAAISNALTAHFTKDKPVPLHTTSIVITTTKDPATHSRLIKDTVEKIAANLAYNGTLPVAGGSTLFLEGDRVGALTVVTTSAPTD